MQEHSNLYRIFLMDFQSHHMPVEHMERIWKILENYIEELDTG